MENELFMNSMLSTWHSQEIPSPEHFSSSLVNKAAAENNPLTNFNSLSAHISPSPANYDNSLLRELIGKMASAGKSSSFGTRSFNGRKISRFCPKRSEGSKDVETEGQAELSSSQEDRILEGGEMGEDLRKRKSAMTLIKVGEVEEDSNSKRTKQIVEDCIHVRSRRGQATDSHILAERMRREKISERMKFLQNLVPGCNKVTGKAVMLDEIINYVQSLQRQVQFLSKKLACMNSVGNDSNGNFNVETLLVQNHILPLNFSNGSTTNRTLHAPQFPPMASDRFNHHEDTNRFKLQQPDLVISDQDQSLAQHLVRE